MKDNNDMTIDEIDELSRIDIIGQNGPTGEHYDEATVAQDDPIRGEGPIILNLVLDDIPHHPETLKTAFIRRSAQGEIKYGYPLQAHNGRDALADLYQEILDAVLYSKQYVEEHENSYIIGVMYNKLLEMSEDLDYMIQERKDHDNMA